MNIVLLIMHAFLVVFDVCLAIAKSSILWGIAGLIWFILLIMDIFEILRGM